MSCRATCQRRLPMAPRPVPLADWEVSDLHSFYRSKKRAVDLCPPCLGFGIERGMALEGDLHEVEECRVRSVQTRMRREWTTGPGC
jgi:hypothetical protein